MASSAAFVSCAFVACVCAALVVSGDDTAVNKRSPANTKIRLVDGSRDSEGRVEVFLEGEWGTVCDDGFNNEEAEVACRMLGYTGGVPTAKSRAHYGEGRGRILLDNVSCRGTETDLMDCDHNDIGDENCDHDEDVGVDCQPRDQIRVRLRGSSKPYRGRLEVFLNGEWGTVCDDFFSDNSAEVVCRMLGYVDGDPVARDDAFYGEGSGPILLDNVDCNGRESNIMDCDHNDVGDHNCDHDEDVGVNCRPSTDVPLEVRLVGGASPSAGRVELRINGVWGTVCDDSPFDDDAARVVCRMLGYTSVNPVVYDNAHYGEGTGPILLDEVDCDGDEDHILRCGNDGIGVHNCDHDEDVGVDCRP